MNNIIEMKKQKKKGFTLVELVIVIVIVGILAGIAGLAYSNVTKNSREAVAKANLRAVKSAIMLYATNHQGEFPANISDIDNLLEPDVKKYANNQVDGFAYAWDQGTATLTLTIAGGEPPSVDNGMKYVLK